LGYRVLLERLALRHRVRVAIRQLAGILSATFLHNLYGHILKQLIVHFTVIYPWPNGVGIFHRRIEYVLSLSDDPRSKIVEEIAAHSARDDGTCSP
jgi:hypothetical protein